ncbi:hypothetical protein BC834DRAFT_967830 [Gloeopeniophorella convolvens]|nr:hypothetical protein BC834DRAFT_967830 [Gloeopeniophorella convolvens]
MGPRPSFSGQLPIESYFKPKATGNTKASSSFKRKIRANEDDAESVSEPRASTTKKKKTAGSSRDTTSVVQSNRGLRDPELVTPKVRSRAFAATSLATPETATRARPRKVASIDDESVIVVSSSSSSPPRELPEQAPRADVSRFQVVDSRLTGEELDSPISSQAPSTPSRPRIMSDDAIFPAHPTTPHSQRIVPSSQWSADEQMLSVDSSQEQRQYPHITDSNQGISSIGHSLEPPHSQSSPLAPLTSSPPQISVPIRQRTRLPQAEEHSPGYSPQTPAKILDNVPLVSSPGGMPERSSHSQQGYALPLLQVGIPLDYEDPTSEEEENFLVNPSPIRRRMSPSTTHDIAISASATTSRRVYSGLRISHAKLRCLPDLPASLDSDGAGLSFPDDDFSLPMTSQDMSSGVGSYLELVGTLPPEVTDFLDMIGPESLPSDQ